MRSLRIAAQVSLVSLAAGAAADPGEVALKVRSSGALLVPVAIDGRGTFDFLLDTGSSHTVVGSELADRLALPVVAKVRVLTPAGAEMGLVVRVQHMDVDSASVEGLTPSVISIARLREREPGVEGVLGQDFLSLFDYTVDYRRKRLRWTAEAAEGPARVPLVQAGDRRLVQVTGNGRPGPALMVPDSGSEGFVIFERNGRTAVRVDETSQLVGVSGLAAEQSARRGVLRELRVGGVTLRNQPAVVLGRDGSSAIEGDGLLPLHQFSIVSFNNREGYLVVRK
jgi:predicted aspartyl protease